MIKHPIRDLRTNEIASSLLGVSLTYSFVVVLLFFFLVNSNECLMTRVQEMSMDYHFKVEQESGSTMHSFFGFNGNKIKKSTPAISGVLVSEAIQI
jgi:hypothetical protein